MKSFPILRDDAVAWEQAEKAWDVYDKLFHNGQTLQRIAERGGFSYAEYQALLAVREQPMRKWTCTNFFQFVDFYEKAR